MDEWMDNGWMDGWINMDGWLDICIYEQINEWMEC